ncbi:DsbA family protein [Actinomarinicola tropica]|uniref:Protein-disulfide isomerase n=1 Tax=Actinomarinicola tropica TaxID=2789776 RepID=A0A5Q2RNM2_9ACTN|nr:DsbA family protein [Actinomarinicola tropica]QGG94785.1 protein-disulfide isomerase [Actinomarinicola tropica]
MASFALTYDYRCPFARIAHLHVLEGLAAGADWDVRFVPFSLGQTHVEDGGVDVWDEPDRDSGLLALQVSVVVRDQHADAFPTVHRELFELRHTHARDLSDKGEIIQVLDAAGLDADAILQEVATGAPLTTVKEEHEASVRDLSVWGVPTFMSETDAVFVRLMEPPRGDAELATSTVERIVDMLTGWPQLNEFKHTAIRR